MTDIKKLSHYDRVIRIVEDQIALERHTAQKSYSRSYDAIQFSRMDAYRHIVKAVTGIDILDNANGKGKSYKG